MTIYELFVRLGADTADYDRKLARASNQLKAFGQQFSEVGSRLTMAVSVPLAGIGVSALVAAGKLEQASVAFTTMMKSSIEAGKHLEQLRQFALKTPFQFSELVDASRRMQALGFAAGEVVPKLRVIGDAVSALGGGAEVLNRVVLAFGQMQAKGKVQAEEMRQLAEAGIPAWDALAKKLNVDVATAMKMVEARAVDAATGITAVMEAMDKRFTGGMAAQAKTLLGLWSNVKDAIFFTLADIGKVLLPTAKDVITNSLQPMLDKAKELAAAFAALDPAAQKASLGIAVLVAALPPLIWGLGITVTNATALATALVKLGGAFGLTQIGTAIYALRNGLVPALTAAEAKGLLLGRALLALPWVALAGGIALVLNKFNDPKAGVAASDESLKRLNERLVETGYIVKTGTTDAMGRLHQAIKEMPPALGSTTVALDEVAVAAEKVKIGWQSLGDVLSNIRQRNSADALLKEWMTVLGHIGTAPVLDLPTIKVPIHADMFVIPDSVTVDWSKFPNLGMPVDLTNIKAATTIEDEFGKTLEHAAEEGKKLSEEVFGPKPRKEIDAFERATRRAFDGMARGMAKSIVEWKGFGETLKSVAKDFAEGMLEAVLRGFLKPLEDLVAKTVAKISGKLMDALGVGGSAASSGASGAAGGIGSAAGGAGGGAASAVAGGAMGWVNAIGSAVSAVSGVIGNFQMAGMNKSLDLIEHETRFSQIHLLSILEKLNAFLPKLSDIFDYGWNAQYPLLLKMTSALESGKGGGNVTIQVNGAGDPRAVAQEVARALRLQVPSAAFA